MAITKDLAPGNYTATYSKDGYDTVNVSFNVSSTGVMTCRDVHGEPGLCGETTIVGRKLTLDMDLWKHTYTTEVVLVTPSKASYNVGETVSVEVKVKNIGSATGKLSSKLKLGTTIIDTKTTTGLIGPATIATLTHSFVATSAMVGAKTYIIESYHLGHPVSGTKTCTITVVAPCPTPTISSISASPSSPKTGESVSFTKVASGGVINAFSWDFGDGSTSTAAHPTHTYTTHGVKTVTLRVTNSCGGTTTKTLSLTVTPATFTIEFASVPAGATIRVT